MWLINTDTLKLEFFTPPKLPKYAILSHTWGEGEVSLQDISDLENAKKKAGFSKIQKTCGLARENGIRYAWADTCCIDKSSSAELSESINSMYKWYQQSEICFAFLEDWSPEWDWADLSPLAYDEISIDSRFIYHEELTKTRFILRKPTTSDGDKGSPLKWFTRGWTLQELIAPAKVQFYDSKWSMRGSKSDGLVAKYLSGITGIRLDILVNGSESALRRVPIGQRMSWAAHRETTRTEDLAYCLLGIFQVNMPMLYGEGGRAFLRLQEEIIKSSTDLSIFAWLQGPDDDVLVRGVLSHHPREFSVLRDCELVTSRYIQTEEITISNKGFRLHTSPFYPLEPHLYVWMRDLMDLGCKVAGRNLGIFLAQGTNDSYLRAGPNRWMELSDELRRDQPRTLYLVKDIDHVAATTEIIPNPAEAMLFSWWGGRISGHSLKFSEMWPPGIYAQNTGTISMRDKETYVGFIKFVINEMNPFDESRKVGELLVVCAVVGKTLNMSLIRGRKAERFEATLRSTWDMDANTAENKLVEYFASLKDDLAREAIITDAVLGKKCHVNMEITLRATSMFPRDPVRTIESVILGKEVWVASQVQQIVLRLKVE